MTRGRKQKPSKTKQARMAIALGAKIVKEVADRLEDQFNLPRGVILLRVHGDI